MPQRFSVLLAFLLLAVAGCSSTRPRGDAPAELPAAFPHHTPDQIRFNLLRPADTLRAFAARASLTLRSPQQSGQFSADLRSRRDDSLYLSISPGLGIEAARALVTPDSFFLYDRIRNNLTFGSLHDAEGILPPPLTGGDLFGSLLGLVAPDAGVAWQITADESHYLLRSPDGLQTFVVDPARWRVVRYERRTPTGEVVEEQVYSDFDRFGDVFLPRRVVFRRPTEETTATVYYRDLTINPDALTFTLRVSASASRALIE